MSPLEAGYYYMLRNILNFCYICVLIFTVPASSQEYFKLENYSLFQSSQIDTAILLSDTPLKSPWGAVLRSSILPGWGQMYTKHYIKAGIALSINAFFAYQIYRYEMKWRDEKNEDFRNKRNRNTWYFAITYLLTMVDAYVDAYLYKFDDAMKISQLMYMREGVWITELNFSFFL